MKSKRGTSKDSRRRAEPDQNDDALPATRTGRAVEFGRLGMSLVSSVLRAGTRRLIATRGDRERAWSSAHRAGASVLLASLGRLRGTAAKMGQFLAQRPGTLPDEYLEAMLSLTDQVPAMSTATIEAQIHAELGRTPRTLFAHFERRPMAAGSFGQVHRATTHDGAEVVVKVQYPAVDEALASDLANLELFLPAFERLTDRDDVREMVDELRERLTEELDYQQEAENCRQFRELFAKEPFVIPEVHDSLSTNRILTMGFVEGESLSDYLASNPRLATRNRATALLLRFHFASVLEHDMLHVDPNPGNYLFREDGMLGVIDFGCVKRFPPEFSDHVRAVYRAAADGRARTIDRALVQCGMFDRSLPVEHRRPMRSLVRLWAKPGMTPNFDFADRSYLDELTQLQHQLMREGAVRVPPEWLFYSRQVLGYSYLFHRLGGRHKSLFVDSFQRIVDGKAPTALRKPRNRTSKTARSRPRN